MSQQVTITSVTANTPVEIFYCDSFSANCVYVSTVSVFPYTFDVPPPYNENNIVIKIHAIGPPNIKYANFFFKSNFTKSTSLKANPAVITIPNAVYNANINIVITVTSLVLEVPEHLSKVHWS